MNWVQRFTCLALGFMGAVGARELVEWRRYRAGRVGAPCGATLGLPVNFGLPPYVCTLSAGHGGPHVAEG